jgi:hypothetical protein
MAAVQPEPWLWALITNNNNNNNNNNNTALDEDERLASRPVRFTPKERSKRINSTKIQHITFIRRLTYCFF